MSYRVLFESEKYGSLREYQPFKRSVCYRNRLYHVQFPHTLFRWIEGNLRVGFLKHKLESWRDLVYSPPVGNVYMPDFRICGCVSNHVDDSIDLFWSSIFTDDGDGSSLRYMFGRFWDGIFCRDRIDMSHACYKRWSKISRKRNAVSKIENRCVGIWTTLHRFTDLWERNINFRASYENAMDKHIKLMQDEGVL